MSNNIYKIKYLNTLLLCAAIAADAKANGNVELSEIAVDFLLPPGRNCERRSHIASLLLLRTIRAKLTKNVFSALSFVYSGVFFNLFVVVDDDVKLARRGGK